MPTEEGRKSKEALALTPSPLALTIVYTAELGYLCASDAQMVKW